MQHHFFRDEPMCKAIFLAKDKESVNGFLHFIRIWMKDTTSLVALSLATGRVIGVAILRYNSDSDKTDAYARIQVRCRYAISIANRFAIGFSDS